jgi:NADP-dependent 3-hydroxy acid dehydrogenase YdfG
MPTIAIVGAGPGLGLSVAKVFGGHGFQAALISRSRDRLAPLVAELAQTGIVADAFQADVADHAALAAALRQAAERFGRIDVMEFSPYAGLGIVQPPDVTVDLLRPDIEQLFYGAVTATQAVLPAMLEAGSGALLFTVGGGSIHPYPRLATANAAQAALRNYVHNLHNTVNARGVQAATVVVNRFIGATPPAPGIPHIAPDALAKRYWDLAADRDRHEEVVGG